MTDSNSNDNPMLWEDLDFLRPILEHSPAAVVVADENANFVFGNTAGLDLLGYTLEELTDLVVTDIDLWHPVNEWIHLFPELLRNGVTIFESRVEAKDGRSIPIEVKAVHIQLKGIDYILGFMTDISSTTATEEKALEMESRLNVILGMTDDKFLIVDDSGVLLDCSQAACDSMGFSREDIIGTDLSAHLDEESIQKFHDIFPRVLKEDGITCEKMKFKTRSGDNLTVTCYPRVLVDPNDTITSIIVKQEVPLDIDPC